MKPITLPASLLLAACAASPPLAGVAPRDQKPAASTSKVLTLAQVSRGLSAIDDAERQGNLPAQRTRWQVEGAANRADPGPQVLATYALPHTDDTWSELNLLAAHFQASAIPWVAIWRIYLEWGVLDQIDRSVPVAREADPKNWLIGLTEAMVAERRGQAGPAGDRYRAVLAIDPENVYAHVGLARLALAAGQEVTARQEADAALKALPGHAPALLVLAAMAEARQDLPGTIALYERVVTANPRDRPSRVKLARALRQRGDLAASCEQWKSALALREDAETLVAVVEAARLCGDVAAEQKALERLSGLDPGSAEWRRIAEIRLQVQDQAGAERALRQAIARDPKDPENQLALGRLLAGTGRITEGLEHLRAAGEIGASDRAAAERRINLRKQAVTDVAALQRAVGALIDTTYRQRLKDLPRLSGTLTIRVTIDTAGRATLVEVLEDTLHDDDVRACAWWNLKDAAYPAQKPGRSSFSFTLRPAR